MTTSHTPGPWETQELEYSFRVVDHRAMKFNNSRICDVQHWSAGIRGPDREEARSNARLIAAAPDLLEALKELLDQDDHGQDEIWVRNKARAAIAKATGEQE